MKERMTVPRVRRSKKPLVMVTAYDRFTASVADESEVDMILVGDSLGMVVQGHPNTLSVTLDEILYHVRSVMRTQPRPLVIADMPYLSYHISIEDTLRNAGRLIKEGGADAVKLEGGRKRLPMVEALIDAEIPVMGHIGLTPQSIHRFGGFKVQGKSDRDRESLKQDALALQQAGVFALVLECVPADLAAEITQLLDIPTIGIGAGLDCGGQVLVIHDLLGMTTGKMPRFVRQYAALHELAQHALSDFAADVRAQRFPSDAESYGASVPNAPVIQAVSGQ